MNALQVRIVRHVWRRASKTKARGFEVGFIGIADHQQLLPKLEAALDVIHDYAPEYAELFADVMPRILVAGTPAFRGRWVPALELCELSIDFVANPQTSIAEVALTLVHEATHARVHARGLRTKGLHFIREERLAVCAELSLARRLPLSEELVTEAEWRWDNAASVYSPSRQIEANLLAAWQLGLPWWMVRILALIKGVEISSPNRKVPAHLVRNNPGRSLRWSFYAAWGILCVVSGFLLPNSYSALMGVVLVIGWTIFAKSYRR